MTRYRVLGLVALVVGIIHLVRRGKVIHKGSAPLHPQYRLKVSGKTKDNAKNVFMNTRFSETRVKLP